MRVRNENDVLSVHAIAGTYCVLLGLDVKKGYGQPKSSTNLTAMLSEMALTEDMTIFVGFAIDRKDQITKEMVSLNAESQPIQKFHFGDYTALPGREYVYTVRRMIKPKSPVDSAWEVVDGSSVSVTVTTEDPNEGSHGIYFNRGAAGSKAYVDKFGEFRKYHRINHFGKSVLKPIIDPRSMPAEKSKEARAWLSRGLEEGLLRFLSLASGSEYRLLAAVYEFTHAETLQAFALAIERGVDVKIVRHWKNDSTTEEVTKAISEQGFKSAVDADIWHHNTFIERKHSSGLMHNKFIILMKNGKPVSVWTGSINFTDSGYYGQSNVGHIVRDEKVADQFLEYWQHLSQDPPGRKHPYHDDNQEPMDDLNNNQQADIEGQVQSPSMHVIFSPRKTTNMLQWYADRLGEATSSVHYTAAFGIAQPIAKMLNQGHFIRDDQPNAEEGVRRSPRIASRCSKTIVSDIGSQLRYILLDSKPSQHSREKNAATAQKKGEDYVDYYDLKKLCENRIAYGTILGDSDECLTGLSTFVDYIHTKYLLLDALTDNPLVVTGSANFSIASTDKNDENSLVIAGDTRVADIYLTECMRLFDHFYSRDKYNEYCARKPRNNRGRAWGEVVADESWLIPYFDEKSQLSRERLFLR